MPKFTATHARIKSARWSITILKNEIVSAKGELARQIAELREDHRARMTDLNRRIVKERRAVKGDLSRIAKAVKKAKRKKK